MAETDTRLTEELMAEALAAVDREDFEQAIATLNRLREIDPDDAMALYLLGTVHASMGLEERAVDEIAEVLEREPEFHVARFQLGLIFLAHGLAEEALAYWEPFSQLGEQDTFFLFRRGIEHFYSDRHPEAVKDLQRGVELNQHYLSVKDDMRDILLEIEGRRSAS